MKKSKTLVFFGNERLSTGMSTDAPVLNALIGSGYKIASVIIAQNEIRSSRRTNVIEVTEIAKQHGIPVLMPFKLSEISETLKAYNAIAGVLVAYGKMIPQQTIDIFPLGIINIHPSLLPKHRGPTPIESAILHGDTTTGVSIMKLTAKMDAGPVYSQATITLSGNETKAELTKSLANIGKNMLIDKLPAILDGTLLPTEQNNKLATYDSLIDKSAGLIDAAKPATVLEREIRAYSEWPKSKLIISDELSLIICKARVTGMNIEPGKITITDNKKLLLGTKNGSLEIIELMPPGKQAMTAAAFINGYGSRIL